MYLLKNNNKYLFIKEMSKCYAINPFFVPIKTQ